MNPAQGGAIEQRLLKNNETVATIFNLMKEYFEKKANIFKVVSTSDKQFVLSVAETFGFLILPISKAQHVEFHVYRIENDPGKYPIEKKLTPLYSDYKTKADAAIVTDNSDDDLLLYDFPWHLHGRILDVISAEMKS